MKFVEVEHKALGRTFVPESRVRHMSEGWAVVVGDKPKSKGDPLRVTQEANTTDSNPEAGSAGANTTDKES